MGATKCRNRTTERTIRTVPVGLAELEIGAQRRQHQGHEFLVSRRFIACILQTADAQKKVSGRNIVKPGLSVRQVRSAVPRCEQMQGRKAEVLPEEARQLERNEGAHAMAKQGEGTIQFGNQG